MATSRVPPPLPNSQTIGSVPAIADRREPPSMSSLRHKEPPATSRCKFYRVRRQPHAGQHQSQIFLFSGRLGRPTPCRSHGRWQPYRGHFDPRPNDPELELLPLARSSLTVCSLSSVCEGAPAKGCSASPEDCPAPAFFSDESVLLQVEEMADPSRSMRSIPWASASPAMIQILSS